MVLSDVLKGLKPSHDKNLLVGFETSDDAAVYKLSDDIAMISTVDFITPPVDDPYWFGQISAANSISDVYSMGGRPVTALNLVMFPSKKLDIGILRDILAGGNDKVLEAGASLAGGHTIDDEEPKYGLCVNGVVHPEKIITNAGAQPGDKLILTKPLGSGVLLNAVRAGKYPYKELEKETLPSLGMLNKIAIELAIKYDINACTDITGFGISGHALEVAKGGNVTVSIQFNKLEFYAGALDMYQKGVTTGSNKPNKELTKSRLGVDIDLNPSQKELLFDPQTSGGLLISLPASQAGTLYIELLKNNLPATIIGEILAGGAQVKII